MSEQEVQDLKFLKGQFAYFTECQLATLEHYRMKTRPPKGELSRHESIANKMVDVCRALDIEPRDERGHCIRLRDRLKALKEGG